MDLVLSALPAPAPAPALGAADERAGEDAELVALAGAAAEGGAFALEFVAEVAEEDGDLLGRVADGGD